MADYSEPQPIDPSKLPLEARAKFYEREARNAAQQAETNRLNIERRQKYADAALNLVNSGVRATPFQLTTLVLEQFTPDRNEIRRVVSDLWTSGPLDTDSNMMLSPKVDNHVS